MARDRELEGVRDVAARVARAAGDLEPDEDLADASPRPLPWLVSGVGAAGLRAQARRVAEFLASDPDAPDADLAYSLARSRAALADRAVVVAADRNGALAGLAALADGDHGPHTAVGTATARDRVAFVFPGQGSQWPGMAAELMRTAPVFRESIEACAASLAPHVDWSLTKVLRGESGAPTLERVDVVQPALFAVMVSLAALWRSCGVEPAAVVGHSQGEIAAAHVAGALSLDDAARVVAVRSRALRVLAGRGGMVSVVAPVDHVRRSIARWGGAVSVAAVNGPQSVVISGEPAALDEALAAFDAGGVRARRIDFEAIDDGIDPATVAVTVEPASVGWREPIRVSLRSDNVREQGPYVIGTTVTVWVESVNARPSPRQSSR